MNLQINLIGFWEEYTKNSRCPSIHKYQTAIGNDLSKGYLDYLKHGIAFMGVRTAINCVLDHNNIITPHGMIYTDGKWIWSDAFIYYVENYNFSIPNDFRTHIDHKKNLKPTIDLSKHDTRIKYMEIVDIVLGHSISSDPNITIY